MGGYVRSPFRGESFQAKSINQSIEMKIFYVHSKTDMKPVYSTKVQFESGVKKSRSNPQHHIANCKRDAE